MAIKDFAHYVRAFAERPSPCFDGMKIGEAFYQPMLQVIDYLQDNGFSVYVCSGSDRLVIRGIVEGGLVLAARYVIGTEELISAKNQGNKDLADVRSFLHNKGEVINCAFSDSRRKHKNSFE